MVGRRFGLVSFCAVVGLFFRFATMLKWKQPCLFYIVYSLLQAISQITCKWSLIRKFVFTMVGKLFMQNKVFCWIHVALLGVSLFNRYLYIGFVRMNRICNNYPLFNCVFLIESTLLSFYIDQVVWLIMFTCTIRYLYT